VSKEDLSIIEIIRAGGAEEEAQLLKCRREDV